LAKRGFPPHHFPPQPPTHTAACFDTLERVVFIQAQFSENVGAGGPGRCANMGVSPLVAGSDAVGISTVTGRPMANEQGGALLRQAEIAATLKRGRGRAPRSVFTATHGPGSAAGATGRESTRAKARPRRKFADKTCRRRRKSAAAPRTRAGGKGSGKPRPRRAFQRRVPRPPGKATCPQPAPQACCLFLCLRIFQRRAPGGDASRKSGRPPSRPRGTPWPRRENPCFEAPPEIAARHRLFQRRRPKPGGTTDRACPCARFIESGSGLPKSARSQFWRMGLSAAVKWALQRPEERQKNEPKARTRAAAMDRCGLVVIQLAH